MSNEIEAAEIAAAAVDQARLREKALTLATAHYRKVNWTGKSDSIVALADAFYKFLIGSPA